MRLQSALIFSLLLALGACGQHQQEGSGSRTGANEVELSPLQTEDLVVQAINADSVEKIKSYVPSKWDVTKAFKNGRTPLTEAAFLGKLTVVAALVDLGADPKAPDLNGESAEAFASTNPGLRRVLFPEWENQQRGVLILAVRRNDHAAVKKQLDEGAVPNFTITRAQLGIELEEQYEGETPLTLGVLLNAGNVVRTLLRPNGPVDVNLPNARGETPLRLARSLGRAQIEKMLIQRGAAE